ncbi:MAG TPA: Tudor-knot domain-containing protein [Chthoniobacterales bacterium]|nr:Tudor-knot domain-containing protein [Chthoniobacterales bacterium]
MKSRTLFPLLLLAFFCSSPISRAKELGWQPQKTWVFVVGVLSWKHSEMFGSFPVKNRRDEALVNFFKQSGVPESQIVYLQDKQARQIRIDDAFTAQLKKLSPDDLLIVYYAGHGSKSDDGNDVFLASYDAGDDEVEGWSINSIPGKIQSSKCKHVLWFIDCCYSGQAGLAITKQASGPAYACVTSSAASESSTEHWTFTEALLDAWRGISYVDLNHDGTVTLAEFAAHVEADMNAAEEQRSTFAHTKEFSPEIVLATAKPLANPRVGERAKARDADEDWYACRVIDVRDEKLKIHFIGYEDDEDTWVAPEDLQPIKPVRYATGAKVEVLWKKRWYPATVLQAKDGVHLIHYTEYEAKWDEWVPSRRIRNPK